MAVRFDALNELFDDALELPYQGRIYRIPSPPAEDGLRIQELTTLAARLVQGDEHIDTTLLDDDEETDLLKLALGPVLEELLADGVDWAWVRHMGLTAVVWITNSVEAAQRIWAAAGDPSRLAPNREARRRKSGSAAAKSTPRRGSTSGTKGRRATGKGRPGAKT